MPVWASQIFMPGGSNRQSVSRASRANPGRGFCQKSALTGLRFGAASFQEAFEGIPHLTAISILYGNKAFIATFLGVWQ